MNEDNIHYVWGRLTSVWGFITSGDVCFQEGQLQFLSMHESTTRGKEKKRKDLYTTNYAQNFPVRSPAKLLDSLPKCSDNVTRSPAKSSDSLPKASVAVNRSLAKTLDSLPECSKGVNNFPKTSNSSLKNSNNVERSPSENFRLFTEGIRRG